MTTILWEKVFDTLYEDNEDAKIDYFRARVAVEDGRASVCKVKKADDSGWFEIFFMNGNHSTFSLLFNEEEIVLDSNDLEY